LTAAGQALAARTLKIQSEVVAAMVEGATEAELAAVADIMQRVSTRLEALRGALGAVAAPTPQARRAASTVRRARPASR
jgi:hypothetical protein